MKYYSLNVQYRTIFLPIAIATLLSLSHLHAAITLTFSGTYDTQNTTQYSGTTGTPSNLTIFGLSQPTANVSYSFTFKDLITPTILTNGTTVTTETGTGVLNQTWYGYSSSDIASISASIGGTTWNVTDDWGNVSQIYGPGNLGIDKNIWFNRDISVAAPTQAVFDLDNSGGLFYGTTKGYLIAGGGFASTGGIVNSTSEAFIGQYTTNNTPDVFREISATSFSITSNVPEPGRSLLLMIGLAGLNLRRKRR